MKLRWDIAGAFGAGICLGLAAGVLVTQNGPADQGAKRSSGSKLTASERSQLDDFESGLVSLMPGVTLDGSFDIEALVDLESQAKKLRPLARKKACAPFEDEQLVRDYFIDTEDRIHYDSIDVLHGIVAGIADEMPAQC